MPERQHAITSELESFIPIIKKVVEQTERRVFRGETVANDEKVFSIFQPEVYCIRKGKSGKPNEFGKKVRFDQCDGKIITSWEIYDKNVSDTETLVPAIQSHVKQFGKAPYMTAGDRGCYSSKTNVLPGNSESSGLVCPNAEKSPGNERNMKNSVGLRPVNVSEQEVKAP